MPLGNVNKPLWDRFRDANRAKGLTTTRTLEKLISVWLDVYGGEDFSIPQEVIMKPDYLNIAESKKLVAKKLKDLKQ